MYWLSLSNSDIKAHFTEIYWVWISESKITYVTNKVFTEIEDWKNRPLKKIYSIIYLDCIHYKVRQDRKIVQCLKKDKNCWENIIWKDFEWKIFYEQAKNLEDIKKWRF